MRRLSDQFMKQDADLDEEKIQQIFKVNVDEYFDNLVSKYDLSAKEFKKIRAYYKEEYPHKFYYSPRKHVIERIDAEIKSRKTA